MRDLRGYLNTTIHIAVGCEPNSSISISFCMDGEKLHSYSVQKVKILLIRDSLP